MRALSVPLAIGVVAGPFALFRRRKKDEQHGEVGDAGGSEGLSPGRPLPPIAPPGSGTLVAPPGAFAGGTAQPTDRHPEANTPVASARPPRPAPHRERPNELWHAPLDAGDLRLSAEIRPEERIGSAELVDRGPGEPGGTLGVVSLDDPASAGPVAPGLGGAAGGASPVGDVITGRDLEDPAPARGRQEAERRPRLRPPTDIFDVAPPMPHDVHDPGASGADGDGALVAAPVGRKATRSGSHRSLFGGGGTAPDAVRPSSETVTPGDSGELVDERGVLRFADRTRPEITRSPADDSFTLDSGWCWVSRAGLVPPARVTAPGSVIVVPAGTKALIVVEADRSTFVSVVSGSAHLDHPDGLLPLEAGSICHVPLEGDVQVDTASPEELEADALLTRNLQMDDALDAITSLRQRASGD